MSNESFHDEAMDDLAEDREYVLGWIDKMAEEGNARFRDSLAAAITTGKIEPISSLLRIHIESDEDAVEARAEVLFQRAREAALEDCDDDGPASDRDCELALDEYERSHGF